MDASENQDVVKLRDGRLVVFTRDRSPYFQCRIKFPRTPYVYKSLSTRDRVEALRLAEDFFAESKFKHENGLNINHALNRTRFAGGSNS